MASTGYIFFFSRFASSCILSHVFGTVRAELCVACSFCPIPFTLTLLPPLCSPPLLRSSFSFLISLRYILSALWCGECLMRPVLLILVRWYCDIVAGNEYRVRALLEIVVKSNGLSCSVLHNYTYLAIVNCIEACFFVGRNFQRRWWEYHIGWIHVHVR